MSSEALGHSYDQTPYQSQPFVFTHPARTSALAALLGMEAPAVQTCRVLEVGCASGGNLIPIAATLPEARFVGIDLSERQIADGASMVDRLQLKNIELRQMDLCDAGGLGSLTTSSPMASIRGFSLKCSESCLNSARPALPTTASLSSASTPSRAGMRPASFARC